jgi:hypothetical protein
MRATLLALLLLDACATVPPPRVALTVACFNGRTAHGEAVPVTPRHLIAARHAVYHCGGEPATVIASWAGHTVEVMPVAAGDTDVALLEAVAALDPWPTWAERSDANLATLGMSGRPVYDRTGKLVGIVVRRFGVAEVRVLTVPEWGVAIPEPQPRVDMDAPVWP